MASRFQNFDKGYDINALGGVVPNADGSYSRVQRPDPPSPNGRLSHPDFDFVPLWVSEITSDFAISGSRGQSYKTRTFFPHNFVQASFNVTCQCANQEIYGRTIEFIRNTQRALDDPVKLVVISKTLTMVDVGLALRGAHQGNEADGYIKSVMRTHKRHEYAPELRFSMVVTQHIKPADWKDEVVAVKSFSTWKDAIENSLTFEPDPNPGPPDPTTQDKTVTDLRPSPQTKP